MLHIIRCDVFNKKFDMYETKITFNEEEKIKDVDVCSFCGKPPVEKHNWSTIMLGSGGGQLAVCDRISCMEIFDYDFVPIYFNW
jgi:hypothetical protein